VLYNNPDIGASCRFFDPNYRRCVVELKNNVGARGGGLGVGGVDWVESSELEKTQTGDLSMCRHLWRPLCRSPTQLIAATCIAAFIGTL
jgi:hypothetical protein